MGEEERIGGKRKKRNETKSEIDEERKKEVRAGRQEQKRGEIRKKK